MARERIDVEVNMSDAPTKRALMTRVGTLQGLYALDLRPIRPTRSQQQNRFWWGVLVKSFVDFNREQNIPCRSENVSMMFKRECGGLTDPVYNPKTGELVSEEFRSTTDYSVEDMSGLIERTIEWLSSNAGIEIPEGLRPQRQEGVTA